MIIQKIANTVGQGVVSRHIENLKKDNYKVFTIRLDQMEEFDLNFKIPDKLKDGKIVFLEPINSIKSNVIRIQNEGKKVAIFLENYEINKKRFPTIEDILKEKINIWELNKDDVIFYQSEDGFPIY